MNNRILTLEEVTSAGRGPIWYQSRFSPIPESVMYMYEHRPNFRFKIARADKSDRHINADPELYGLTWRCWEKKPNQGDIKQPFSRIGTEAGT